MTHTAAIMLDEDQARRLGDAIGEDDTLGFPTVDAVELTGKTWRLTVYFTGQPSAAEQKRLNALADEVVGKKRPAITIEKLAEEDWIAKSLQGLKPVRAGRFLVHGRHDRGATRPNDVAIEIEAGQAFGTGHHGTTAGCLLALEEVLRRDSPRNALDLGTGSGVLAVALAKAWRIPVLATDIDPVATRVARENARLNGAASLIEAHTATGFGHPAFAAWGPFDLIVANILAGPLCRMATDLAGHLAPGGTVILSGILPDQGRMVVAAYRNAGLHLRRIRNRDGWLTLVLMRH